MVKKKIPRKPSGDNLFKAALQFRAWVQPRNGAEFIYLFSKSTTLFVRPVEKKSRPQAPALHWNSQYTCCHRKIWPMKKYPPRTYEIERRFETYRINARFLSKGLAILRKTQKAPGPSFGRIER